MRFMIVCRMRRQVRAAAGGGARLFWLGRQNPRPAPPGGGPGAPPPPPKGVDKVNTLRKNEIFIFPSCIIFLCRPSKGFALRRVRSANFQFAVASRANALPPFVTFGDGRSEVAFTRLEVRGRPKGPRRTEPQPGEAEVGARRKMIKETATWAAPTARRQNLRFCRRGRRSRLGSPKGFQP